MTIAMLSLAGLPATAGFIGKFYLIDASVAGDYTWLGIVIVIGSVVSLAYYLRVIAVMWMGSYQVELPTVPPRKVSPVSGWSPEADARAQPEVVAIAILFAAAHDLLRHLAGPAVRRRSRRGHVDLGVALAAAPRARYAPPMSENLAGILTDTAERHGDLTAFQLDDIELTYAALDETSARIAALLRATASEAGDRVGLMLPNVPYFPASLLRDPARGRGRRADERAAQGPRGHLLPRGPGRQGRLRMVRLRRRRRGGRRAGRRRVHPRQARASSSSSSWHTSPSAPWSTAPATTRP